MGMFEKDAYSRGTFAIARAVADAYATTIVGGGDTDVAVHKAGVSDSITFISTAAARRSSCSRARFFRASRSDDDKD